LEEAIEKVHYAIKNNTPVWRKYIYKVDPDANLSIMIPHKIVKENLSKEYDRMKKQGMTDKEKETLGMRFKEFYREK